MRDLPQGRSKILPLRIETNLLQGDLGVEEDSVEGDLAETENSIAAFFKTRKLGYVLDRQPTMIQRVISDWERYKKYQKLKHANM